MGRALAREKSYETCDTARLRRSLGHKRVDRVAQLMSDWEVDPHRATLSAKRKKMLR